MLKLQGSEKDRTRMGGQKIPTASLSGSQTGERVSPWEGEIAPKWGKGVGDSLRSQNVNKLSTEIITSPSVTQAISQGTQISKRNGKFLIARERT